MFCWHISDEEKSLTTLTPGGAKPRMTARKEWFAMKKRSAFQDSAPLIQIVDR